MTEENGTKDRLQRLRVTIEQMSEEVLELLSARASAVREIAAEKRALGLPLRDRRREEELLTRLAGKNLGPLDKGLVRGLFQQIIDACVAVASHKETPGLRVGAAAGPRRTVRAAGHGIGPNSRQYIAGPCAVESESQMEEVAAGLAKAGVRFLRGGTFKPRTSPYAFQGLEQEGVRLLCDAATRHGMASITESTSLANLDVVAKHADVVQIGARNMQNYELLRAAGRTGKPILLKRGFGATLDEWLHSAEYIAVSGSEDIILCERGIRTFVHDTRSTLDLSAVPLALAGSRLPVIVDVSHAAGRRDLIAPMAGAAFAAGAFAVMVEVHPDPDSALSDSEQQITIEDFGALRRTVVQSLTETASALLDSIDGRERRTKETKHATQRAL